MIAPRRSLGDPEPSTDLDQLTTHLDEPNHLAVNDLKAVPRARRGVAAGRRRGTSRLAVDAGVSLQWRAGDARGSDLRDAEAIARTRTAPPPPAPGARSRGCSRRRLG